MHEKFIGVLLLLLLLRPVVAQDSDESVDDVEPAVDTSSVESAAPISDDVRRVTATEGVMDELDLDRTEITGNQELPKVLYIVPWQKSDPGELMGRPVNTLLDEVLAPIDRTEFVRQVRYYEDLQND